MSWEKEEAKSRHVDFQVSDSNSKSFLWNLYILSYLSQKWIFD